MPLIRLDNTDWRALTQYGGASLYFTRLSSRVLGGGKKRSNMLFTHNSRPVIANLFDRQPGNDGISPLAAETKRE